MLADEFDKTAARSRLGERALSILRARLVEGVTSRQLEQEYGVSRQYIHDIKTKFIMQNQRSAAKWFEKEIRDLMRRFGLKPKEQRKVITFIRSL